MERQVVSQLPLEYQRRKKLAAALKAQAGSQPVKSHMQGLAKLLQSGIGAYQETKANNAKAKFLQGLDTDNISTSDLANLATIDPSMATIYAAKQKQDATIDAARVKAENEAKKPSSSVGKIQRDMDAGLISQEAGQAAIAKATGGTGLNITTPDGMVIQQGYQGQRRDTKVDNLGGGKKFVDTAGANVANIATPTPDENIPTKATNTIAMLQEALELNKTALGGTPGKVMDWLGDATNDAVITEGVENQRNALSKQIQIADTVTAEMVKPTVGGSQISDNDIKFVANAVSFPKEGSTSKKEAVIVRLLEVAQRKRDIAALEQEAAQQGRAFTQDDVRAYYTSIGIDYDTGADLRAPKQQPAWSDDEEKRLQELEALYGSK